MILMAVCDDYCEDFVAVLLKVRYVWDYVVDSGQFAVREFKAGVDDDNLIAVFENVHVLADFAQASERYEAESLLVCVIIMSA